MLSYFSPRITADIDTLILLVFFGVLVFGFIYVSARQRTGTSSLLTLHTGILYGSRIQGAVIGTGR